MEVFFSRTSSQIIWKTLPVFVFIRGATNLAGPISEDIIPSIHFWASLLFLRCLFCFCPHHFLRNTMGLWLSGTSLECSNGVPVLYHPLLLKCYVLPPGPLPCISWCSLNHDQTRCTRKSPAPLRTLSKAAQTPQDTKAPEHRQTTTCSLLALYSQLSIPHSTTACLFLLSGAAVLPACVCLKWIHKVAFWRERERGHMDSIFCTHVYSFSLKHDFTICLIVS